MGGKRNPVMAILTALFQLESHMRMKPAGGKKMSRVTISQVGMPLFRAASALCAFPHCGQKVASAGIAEPQYRQYMSSC
jgi:hypothetical protein